MHVAEMGAHVLSTFAPVAFLILFLLFLVLFVFFVTL
jgi:hypothetical protein